ncbi:hypothetical protein A7E75_06655 [Syntrophotalea acetylenica]|uniref:DUF3106 domain-containing protein n=2 Tax=Syntrophotalea acetylenica TaxID=29542 RepID=A0A1L3GFK9_SYNAC|nr:hypothetical protein A7E75_06655 [Syntrophotalea acetylenica]APG42799.1 hypothetical protein A6070_00590 [Syntrophotalea acetylenica]
MAPISKVWARQAWPQDAPSAFLVADDGRRWEDLTPEQRRQLKGRYRQYKEMAPDEQQRLRQRYDQYQDLPPAERERLKQRMERWQRLPEDKRQEIKQRYQRYRQLPPEKQQELRKQWREQKKLPPSSGTNATNSRIRSITGTVNGKRWPVIFKKRPCARAGAFFV